VDLFDSFGYCFNNCDYQEQKVIKIAIICGCLLIAGCANQQHRFQSPSPASVSKDLNDAKQSASELEKYVAPEGKEIARKLECNLNSAFKSLLDYSIKVDAMSKELVKAQDDVAYWHSKQVKGLKEIWLWRSIAIVSVLSVIAYIGLKTSWRFFL